jgi:very-short-patch-repair endonuclease
MASGRKPKAPFFYPGDIKYSGFVRGVRREGDRDKHGSVKVLVQNGKPLERPKIIEQTAKGDMAANLRMNAPKSERLIVEGMAALGFEHSSVVYGYIADFFHPAKMLVVEIDGPHHLARKAEDRKRDNDLINVGIDTMRISAEDIYESPSAVIARVAAAVGSAVAA